jgi:hypothetical protein
LNRIQGVGVAGEVSDKPCLTDSVSVEFHNYKESVMYRLANRAASSDRNLSQSNPRNGTAGVNWRYYSDKIDDFCAGTDGACCKDQINLFAHLGYFTKENVEAASNFVLGKFNGTL